MLQTHYRDHCEEEQGAWVVQKYVEAPLLYRGRKFDVRIFALLESARCKTWSQDLGEPSWASGSRADNFPLLCIIRRGFARQSAACSLALAGFSLYAYREGYGRTSSEVFSLSDMHSTMHLTNFSIQKQYPNTYGKHEIGNSVSFYDLDAHLGPSVGFRERIEPAMHALMADTVLAGRSELLDVLHGANAHSATFRTLLAFDLIVEADGTPVIMEVNPFPGMTPQSEWHSKYLARLLDDYVGACVDQVTHPAGIQKAGAEARDRPLFDGCHIPNCKQDDWVLLLDGCSTASGTPAEARAAVRTAAFDVKLCGSKLIRVRRPHQSPR